MQGGVPPFVLTADLSPLGHQQAHYVQMTCRETPRWKALSKTDPKKGGEIQLQDV